MNWILLQTQLFFISLPAVIIFLIALGLVGLGLLWYKGKRIEALSLLNTMLLMIVIILLLVPH